MAKSEFDKAFEKQFPDRKPLAQPDDPWQMQPAVTDQGAVYPWGDACPIPPSDYQSQVETKRAEGAAVELKRRTDARREWELAQNTQPDMEKRFQPPPDIVEVMNGSLPMMVRPESDAGKPMPSPEDLHEQVDYLTKMVVGLWEWGQSQAAELAAAHRELRELIQQRTPKFGKDQRDAWIYEQASTGLSFEAVYLQLKGVAEARGWPLIKSEAVRLAAERHAQKNGLPTLARKRSPQTDKPN